MLQSLGIHHFAIIDELRVEFAPGLNIITGETGAGKSILISAVNLLMGGRATADLIRTGADEARVEASFHVDDPIVLRELDDMGLRDGHALAIQRVVSRSGRNRVWVNGSPATVGMLGRLAPRLIDVSGQHEHHSLLDSDTHLGLVDAHGDHGKLVLEMSRAYRAYARAHTDVEALAAKESSRLAREDYLRFQLNELQTAAVQRGEEEALSTQRQVLSAAEELGAAARFGYERLYAADGAVAELLGAVIERVRAAAQVDESLEVIVKSLGAAHIEVQEAARELQQYGDRADVDPARLEEIETRLAQLQGLRKKHGTDCDGLVELTERLLGELEELTSFEAALDAKRQHAAELLEVAQEVGRRLSKRRKKSAAVLAQGVRAQLEDLGMKDVRFEVARDSCQLSADGGDAMEFLFSPNPGEDPRPLVRIASGGELSRVTLALKCSLLGQHPVASYIFDEVDAGIGGAVAEVVGRKIEQVAGSHQVLCITHLPQIAVFGAAHYQVIKTLEEGRTRIRIETLTPRARTEEIARMLGGLKITAKTRAHASELLRSRCI